MSSLAMLFELFSLTFVLLFFSTSLFGRQTDARNIYFPINQAVYFADDHSLVDSNVMNALHDRVAPSRNLRIRQNLMSEEESPRPTFAPKLGVDIVDLSKIIYGKPFPEQSQSQQQQQVERQQPHHRVLYGRPFGTQPRTPASESREPAVNEPTIGEIIGEVDDEFTERMLNSNTNETALAGGGCFCCRAFVCQRQKKCPCSRFIF